MRSDKGPWKDSEILKVECLCLHTPHLIVRYVSVILMLNLTIQDSANDFSVFMQMGRSGGTFCRHAGAFLSSDSQISSSDKPTYSVRFFGIWNIRFLFLYFLFGESDTNRYPLLAQLKVSDTSTAESGSELEEMASPKTNTNNHVPKLTPVSEYVSVLM